MRTALTLAVISILAVVWLCLGRDQDAVAAPGAAPPSQPSGARDIPFRDQQDWLGKLRTRAEITFVADQRSPAEESILRQQVGKLTSLGNLEGGELVTAKSFAEGLYDLRQKDLLAIQQRLQPTSLQDAYDEAKGLHAVEVALAVQECFRSGDYIVLPQGQQLPTTSAEDVLTMGVTKDGKAATAVFVILHDKHPQLAALKNYFRATEDVFLEDLVLRFNTLPLDTRRQMLSRHEALTSVSKQAWTAEDRKFCLEWFPVWIDVEPATATLRKTPR